MKTVDHVCSAFLRQILLRMKELGLSQTDLAKRMKVSRPYITKVLRQDVNFSFRTAAKLARALQMDFTPELHPSQDHRSEQLECAIIQRRDAEAQSTQRLYD